MLDATQVHALRGRARARAKADTLDFAFTCIHNIMYMRSRGGCVLLDAVNVFENLLYYIMMHAACI